MLKVLFTWETLFIASFFVDDFSSKLYFKNPDKSDLGTYSISVSDTDGVSSSFIMDEQGKVLTIFLHSITSNALKTVEVKKKKESQDSHIISYALKKRQKRPQNRLGVITYFLTITIMKVGIT